MFEWKDVRKKPVKVKAFKLTEELYEDFLERGNLNSFFEVNSMTPIWCCNKKLIITTLEGNMEARIGDWIIKGVNNELYPCKPDVFEKTYEILEEKKNEY